LIFSHLNEGAGHADPLDQTSRFHKLHETPQDYCRLPNNSITCFHNSSIIGRNINILWSPKQNYWGGLDPSSPQTKWNETKRKKSNECLTNSPRTLHIARYQQISAITETAAFI